MVDCVRIALPVWALQPLLADHPQCTFAILTFSARLRLVDPKPKITTTACPLIALIRSKTARLGLKCSLNPQEPWKLPTASCQTFALFKPGRLVWEDETEIFARRGQDARTPHLQASLQTKVLCGYSECALPF